jgi:hypothetical protein
MKKIQVCCLLFVVSGLVLAQSATGGREEKLQQLKNREEIKVTEVEKNILKLEYPNGKVMYKNIEDYQHPVSSSQQPEYSSTYDSTIIDLTTIDTTLYYEKYLYLQEVTVGNGINNFLLVGDVNNNNLPELYGRTKDYTTDYSNIVIFERNPEGGFDYIYSYDSTIIARSIFDIDKDGNDETHIVRHYIDSVDTNTYNLVNQFIFYKKNADTSLAKNLFFKFEPWRSNMSQQDDNTFGDWDGDDLTDQIFHRQGIGLNIFEYNPQTPNFDSIYFYDYTPINQEFASFTINDFDQDGKTEFLTGSTHGDVLSIENTGNNSYTPNWLGQVETYNAYQLAQTNDIDGNGKKEIWVGGDAFYPGIGSMTRITLFEANGNNSYQIVGRIDLVGVFSFFAQNYQAVDVDKDGIEEMMICIEQTVLILKFNGSTNHHSYELFYYRRNNLPAAGRNSVYYGATLYDLNNDGKEEILVTLDDIIENVGLRMFSKIYKPNFADDVETENESLPHRFSLFPNFPNPFNPQTKIRIEISKRSFATIKVYNSLGKEITTLLDNEMSPGNYSINWEAKDSNGNILPSGVYLIRMTVDNYTETIKALLLK